LFIISRTENPLRQEEEAIVFVQRLPVINLTLLFV